MPASFIIILVLLIIAVVGIYLLQKSKTEAQQKVNRRITLEPSKSGDDVTPQGSIQPVEPTPSDKVLELVETVDAIDYPEPPQADINPDPYVSFQPPKGGSETVSKSEELSEPVVETAKIEVQPYHEVEGAATDTYSAFRPAQPSGPAVEIRSAPPPEKEEADDSYSAFRPYKAAESVEVAKSAHMETSESDDPYKAFRPAK